VLTASGRFVAQAGGGPPAASIRRLIMCPFEKTDLPDNPDLADMLARRGFTRETVPALLLLPMVHVAWSDGTVDADEAAAIAELGRQSGLLPTDACADLLQSWLSERPDPLVMDANLELLSLLFASVGDELPVSVSGVQELAEAIGQATGGVFGSFFRINSAEKAALAEIRTMLGVDYDDAWKRTLEGLRDDWKITDWVDFSEPTDTAGIDADDPLLFVSPEAVERYEEGSFTGSDGKPLTREDLVDDLKTEVMRTQPWGRDELQFRWLLDHWLERKMIEDAGVFWNSSPHATVYRALANLKFRIDRKTYRIKKGEQLVFMCQMDREMMTLDGPFLAGEFSAQSDAMLCGDMSNAMMDMSDPTMGMDDPTMGMGGMEGEMTPPPRLEVADLRVVDNDRIAYILLDCSGSMGGERMRMAKQAVLSFLQRIPAGAGVRVVVRPFDSKPSGSLLPVGVPFTAQTRMAMMSRMNAMRTGGRTALFQSVNLALDDVLRLANPERMTVPKTHLIVLSDGADNEGLPGYRYGMYAGARALFTRMKDNRDAGVIEYLPIAYGGRDAVRGLEEIGGKGFKVQVTSPADIVAKFGEIREQLMVGMPMGGGMAMRPMRGKK
jgi:VWA domain-containing protein